ncbi:MAG TPA: FAD-dependent oxidoreductase [Candidatus Acidoferrales bacterium]|nr:FAD-dependent oxidoreductase [Candidatus Acidoferrales bacterium]
MIRRVAIVGAGVTGLVAGRALARLGYAVEVFDRWPDVGGQASAFDVGNGVFLDRYYHHLFESDSHMTALHEELLPGELEWHASTMAMYADGRFWPFVTPLDLLRYAPLTPIERARLGIAVLRLVRTAPGESDHRTSALEWLRRWCGDRVVERVWAPLLLGKFGDEARDVPLVWLRSKLVLRRQRLAGRGAGRELLGYPRGSFRAVSVALADDIRRRGGTLSLDREVVAIEPHAAGFTLRCAAPGAYRSAPHTARAVEGREATADLVLLTPGTPVVRGLVAWPPDFAQRLALWRCRTAVVLLLELAAPFGDVYWTNVVDREAPFLALIEHTNLVPAERYPARYLYVSNYVAQDDPLVGLSTDGLIERYLPMLARMRPGFDRGQIQRAWSFREECAQPVPTLTTRERMLPFTTPVPGLFMANTTQIYPEDRGTNYSVRLGNDVAAAIARGS